MASTLDVLEQRALEENKSENHFILLVWERRLRKSLISWITWEVSGRTQISSPLIKFPSTIWVALPHPLLLFPLFQTIIRI